MLKFSESRDQGDIQKHVKTHDLSRRIEKCSLCIRVSTQVCAFHSLCPVLHSKVSERHSRPRRENASIPSGSNNQESNRVLFLLLRNRVKEQCYQEKTSEYRVEHNRKRWKIDTRSLVSRGSTFYLLGYRLTADNASCN